MAVRLGFGLWLVSGRSLHKLEEEAFVSISDSVPGVVLAPWTRVPACGTLAWGGSAQGRGRGEEGSPWKV